MECEEIVDRILEICDEAMEKPENIDHFLSGGLMMRIPESFVDIDS